MPALLADHEVITGEDQLRRYLRTHRNEDVLPPPMSKIPLAPVTEVNDPPRSALNFLVLPENWWA